MHFDVEGDGLSMVFCPWVDLVSWAIRVRFPGIVKKDLIFLSELLTGEVFCFE